MSIVPMLSSKHKVGVVTVYYFYLILFQNNYPSQQLQLLSHDPKQKNLKPILDCMIILLELLKT